MSDAPAAAMRSGHAARLSDGRLHLQHGPIDLVLDIDADRRLRATLERAALEAFDGLLEGLVARLEVLRCPCVASALSSVTSRPLPGDAAPSERMLRTAARFAAHTDFVTPMAAVAGAVADRVLSAMLPVERTGERARLPRPRRIAVNNGGDIALWLAPGECYRIGLCADPGTGAIAGSATLATPGRHGVATSGWPGRSRSLGIADAVTVIAEDAATADVAATLIANAVDLPAGDPAGAAIHRRPANALDDDSDLGERWVTVAVPALDRAARARALAGGRARASRLHRDGLIEAAWLRLQGDSLAIGASAGALDGSSGLRQSRRLATPR